jgi:N utilization substance protein B
MGKRREGREAAVQFLVYCDLNQGSDLTGAEDFWNLRPATKSIRDFATNLVEGVLKHRAETDERIARYAENYDLHRLAVVDRNILRLAIYEMLHRRDIPPVVSINEAIEIAKRFGAEESSRFVNGILDRVKLDLTRPLRTADGGAPQNEREKPAA